MTRINCVPVEELGHRHLIAELRELPRISKYLIRSLKRHNNNWRSLEKEIPSDWTLNKGHVKFHYNKLGYIIDRYMSLVQEAERRNYKIDARIDWITLIDRLITTGIIPESWYGNFAVTDEALRLNRERIAQRNGGNLYEE